MTINNYQNCLEHKEPYPHNRGRFLSFTAGPPAYAALHRKIE